ncbi:MAG TPA: hypothetical protein VNX02_10040 [Steroidobacteraceae bacterium]|jgi:hypothetical protein|nr:hypothetical protein [Steroidobacteraceae bacterium]
MKTILARTVAHLSIAFLAVTTAAADSPKPTEAEARAKIEAQALARSQAGCEKRGMVALGQHVNGTYMIHCVSADDPAYKAQQGEKPSK